MSSFVLAYVVLAAAAAPLAVRDVPAVKADVAAIASEVASLTSAINSFPSSGGSVIQALGIHTDVQNVDSAVKKGTADTQAVTDVSESDGQTIANAFQTLQPAIIAALAGVADKKAGFDSLPIGGASALVLADLTTLYTDTKAFESALTNAAPADLKAKAMSISAAINDAFTKAIAAYN